MRPASIILFERTYGVAVAINLLTNLYNLPKLVHVAQSGSTGGPVSPSVLLLLAGGVVLLDILLWYLAARRASNLARWTLVVLAAIGLLGIVLSILSHRFAPGLLGILSAIVILLKLAGLVQLFRPDANRWFAGEPQAAPDLAPPTQPD